MKLCLSMIVKNESARIERALASAAQFIDSWVIVDTGSTDDTKQKIVDFFAAHKIPGEIRDAPFEDWSQARNAALDWARKLSFAYQPDYFLLMDADMEIVVRDAVAFLGTGPGLSWDMYQHAGSVKYQNRRLVSAQATGGYRGVTHEYLDIASAGCIPPEVAFFVDHADGANRPEKFKRDIRLLRADLKKNPTTERSYFYLANSYRDAGLPHKAINWYKRRIAAGGWDEEVWQSEVYLAHCYKDIGNEGEFIRTLLSAYNRRPTRAEPMYDLANYFRHKGMNAPALAAAEAVVHLPLSTDALFVNEYVYKAGIKEELSICSFYVPGKRAKGLKVTSDLSLQAGPYGGARELARNNMYWYLQSLESFCPSFKWKTIDFEPPVDWVAMNPSVTLHNNMLHCNVRCVNYRIDEQGRYIIKATDGTANDSNPINTRNFVLQMGADPHSQTRPWITEVIPPPDLPCEFKAVIGFEDMRLFSWAGNLWTSSTVRQIHPDGNCEQVLSHLVPSRTAGNEYLQCALHRMLRQPRETEKNWAPLPYGNKLRFMWRPGEIVDTNGVTLAKHDTGMTTGHISGSSQLVDWPGGFLAIVHEARYIPGSPGLRYYYHRFAKYAIDGKLLALSLPFFFNDKVIEFCAGMCWHPNGKELVISYGFKDNEARIATIDYDEVNTFICASNL